MTRLALGLLGVAAAAYGALLLVTRLDAADLLATAAWLVAGVVVHDAVLAPLVVGSGLLVARVLPGSVRGPFAVGALVLGPVTLLAVPVLGRFGARPDNATLLDRDYGTGWLLLVSLTVLGVALGVVVGSRRRALRPGPGEV